MAVKILVVEDEGDLRELMLKSLSDAGYEVSYCDNGREVLECAAKTKPDLLLLDIMLPGVDGLELAKKMADDPAFSSLPMLAVSALEHSRKQLEMLPQCRGFISKPFAMTDLLRKIRVALRKTAP